MKYLSVCSGIEAATVAWHPLGWEPVAFAEIEKFPSAVLAHHYPAVPNWGDLTRFKEWPDATVDLLVGGTPCQSFSVAGLRKGLDDPRGNLALTFLAIADRYRPRWVVWENVPGVLSSVSHAAPDPCPPPPPVDLGRDGAEVETEDEYDAEEVHAFNCLLAGFSELGYLGGYFSLDAQYAGLAQRRERVFAIFHLGDWRRAAAVLFERESLSGHPAPRRETGEAVTGTLSSRTSAGGGLGTDFDCDGGAVPVLAFGGNNTSGPIDVATAVQAHGGPHGRQDFGSETFIADTVRSHPRPGSNSLGAIAFSVKDYGADAGELAPTLRAGGHAESHANGGVMPVVAFHNNLARYGGEPEHERTGPLKAVGTKDPTLMMRGMQVRRLTPRECERLQGFPDDYTRIPLRNKAGKLNGKWAKDGPRYKALGNSMAVPVMAWIGRRIALVEAIGEA